MKTILSSRRHHYVARVGIFLIMVALIAGMVGCNGGGTTFYGGSGTVGDPYQIANWHHLHNIRNYLDSHFILINDLDSTTAGYTERASPTANGGKGWEPIGSIGDVFTFELIDPFTGTFDGQGYEIEDLFIDRPDEDKVGVAIFGAVDVGGVIENVEVMDADVTGFWGVGILVGGNGGSVSSSYSTGSVSGSAVVGGLIGGTGTSGSISDSYSIASVSGFTGVGGLVAWNSGNVSNSYADGDVTGEYNVGGLAGANYYGTVGSSHATGSVTGSSNCTGGLVGENYFGTVVSSHATGSVTGGNCTGGLVGWSTNSSVSDSYATGSVTGGTNVGGLVGYKQYGTVSDSFWDTQTSGQATSAGGTGMNTTEMKDITTFSDAGWDIISVDEPDDRNTGYIWNIVDDATYPFLSWQPV